MSSILRREIFGQPDVLAKILDRETRRVKRLAQVIARRDPRVVLVVARGSADNAGLYGKYLFGALNRKVVALATPSLFTRYGRVPDVRDALVLAISQSGESFDVVEVVEAARRAGALTVAVTNTRTSPLTQASDEVLLCHAGKERSVAATKTYTAQVMLLALLASAMHGDPRLVEQLQRMPQRVRLALELEGEVDAVAQRLRYLEHCAVVGRGFCYGTAFELALKLQELTYVVAQPYSSADFRHGPIAMVNPGFCVVLLAPGGKVLADVRLLQQQLMQRQAEVVALSDDRTVLRRATRGLCLPSDVPEWLTPLTCIIPGQLLAMHLCHAKGYPLDRPRGLSKVTRTR